MMFQQISNHNTNIWSLWSADNNTNVLCAQVCESVKGYEMAHTHTHANARTRTHTNTHTASGLCPHHERHAFAPTLSPNNGERWKLLKVERKIHAEVGAEESSDGYWNNINRRETSSHLTYDHLKAAKTFIQEYYLVSHLHPYWTQTVLWK